MNDPTFDPSRGETGPGGQVDPPMQEQEQEHADPLAELRRERDDFQDRWLRQTAEFDNFRKRMERERRELADYAASEVLHELLPVLDDIERALEASAASSDPAVASHHQGLELIHRQFSDLLRKRHVSAVDALGADFDPNLHQAVSQEFSDAHREGEVMQELRRGYLLKDRLLRPAMVKVATRG